MAKKTFGVVALALGMLGASQQASAYNAAVSTSINMNGAAVTEACNYDYNFPLFCKLYVRGVYYNGHGMEAWQTRQLMPGQCAWVFVNPGYGAVFSYSEGDAFCQGF